MIKLMGFISFEVNEFKQVTPFEKNMTPEPYRLRLVKYINGTNTTDDITIGHFSLASKTGAIIPNETASLEFYRSVVSSPLSVNEIKYEQTFTGVANETATITSGVSTTIFNVDSASGFLVNNVIKLNGIYVKITNISGNQITIAQPVIFAINDIIEQVTTRVYFLTDCNSSTINDGGIVVSALNVRKILTANDIIKITYELKLVTGG